MTKALALLVAHLLTLRSLWSDSTPLRVALPESDPYHLFV